MNTKRSLLIAFLICIITPYAAMAYNSDDDGSDSISSPSFDPAHHPGPGHGGPGHGGPGHGHPGYPGHGGPGHPGHPGYPGHHPGYPGNYPGHPHHGHGSWHDPYHGHNGHYPWNHWHHPGFVRPVYGWDWYRVVAVTCTAEDSMGDLYPVTEDGYIGNVYHDRIEYIQDAALDRCYEETNGDQGCWLLGCEAHY